MMIRCSYACGCEKDTKHDGRYADERYLCALARDNNGKLKWTGKCCECKKKDIATKIDEISLEEAKRILRKMSSNRTVREMMGIERNELVSKS